MAVRLNMTGAQFPKPSPELIAAMAQAGAEAIYELFPELPDEERRYELKTEQQRNNWETIARAMYGALAARSGAALERIPDKPAGRAKKRPPGEQA